MGQGGLGVCPSMLLKLFGSHSHFSTLWWPARNFDRLSKFRDVKISDSSLKKLFIGIADVLGAATIKNVSSIGMLRVIIDSIFG